MLSVKFSIRSLNHRFLDWTFRGTQIGQLENRLRIILQRKIHRGRIEVFLELSYHDSSPWELCIKEDMVQKILSSLDKLSARLKTGVNLTVENLFSLPHVVELKRKELSAQETSFLERSFEKTLDEVLRMRKREGREIIKELRHSLSNIKKILRRIERLASEQPLLIREKLIRRLKELNLEDSLSESKLVEEAAYYAQRYDINEETARLKSHLDSAFELLSPSRDEPVGKKLDFIAQEIFREANTINSKSQDIELIKDSLAIKAEVEGIRQHVQNIE